MEKEIIQLFSKFGIDIKNIDTEMKTSINIDATGRRKEIEDIAYELDIEIKEGKTQFMTAVECISLAGSVITIIDFLLKMKKKYGKTLMVGIKSSIIIKGEALCKIASNKRDAEGLAAARSRSRSDNTPCCHSLRSRRYATSSPTINKDNTKQRL